MSEKNGQPATPQLDRLLSLREKLEEVEGFIDFLKKENKVVADKNGPYYHPTGEHKSQLAARYKDIDLAQVEEEKQLLREHELKKP